MLCKTNGEILNETLTPNEKTANYLKRFWKITSKEELEKEREKLISYDRSNMAAMIQKGQGI